MEPIKQEIINNIFENGDKLITGPILQTVLIDMIDDVNGKDQEILSKTGSWDEAVTQIPNLATKAEVTNLSESVARDLENVVDVDLTGYATEQWVQNQGYLKEHQDISGLATKTELTEAENNLQGNITSLSESVARDLANVSVPEGVATEAWVQSQDYASKTYVDNAVSSSSVDLTGYATEQWVESKGYLTEHQDISNLATKGELNSVSQSIQTDISNLATKTELNDTKNNLQGNITSLSESVARDLTGYATETWVQSQGYLTEHQDISGLATKSELTTAENNLQGNITSLSESVASSAVWKKGTGTDSVVQILSGDNEAKTPTATKLGAIATGKGTNASGMYSHAEGENTEAPGPYSHAEGSSTGAKGYGSHAEGTYTGAAGAYSHAEGISTKTSGDYSHAEGQSTNAPGQASHAEGQSTEASGKASHAEGKFTNASGSYSHAEGYDTIASNDYEHAQGQYNHNSTNQIFSVGAGEKIGETVTRRNAVSILEVPNSDTQVVTASFFVQNVGGYDGTNPEPGTNDLATVINGLSSGGGSSETLWEKGEGQDSLVQVTTGLPHYKPKATGTGSIATGYDTKASENYSHAEGNGTKASGQVSHAEGGYTVASGSYSHAEGYSTIALGNFGSHAEGRSTTALEFGSHAEGESTIASGRYSHAEGNYTTASGWYSHAEGQSTNASGWYSHAEGTGSKASGQYSHAEGDQTKASGKASHAEGSLTIASNEYEHAQGRYNHTSSNQIFSIGTGNSDTDRRNAVSVLEVDNSGSYTSSFFVQNIGGYDGTNPTPGTNDLATVINGLSSGGGSSETLWKKGTGKDSAVLILTGDDEAKTSTATGAGAVAIGSQTKAAGAYSYAEGERTSTSGWYSHAEGLSTKANGYYSHAEGSSTVTSENYSHAEGHSTNASGMYSHAEGYGTKASGQASHAEGESTIASGSWSHVEGESTLASGICSHAEGYFTTSSGDYSHAEGNSTLTSNEYEHAQGRYNHSSTNQIFSIGTGNSDTDRRNVVSVLEVSNNNSYTGSFFVQNIGGYDGTNPLPGTNDLATVINGMSTGGGSSETLWKKGTGTDSIVQILTGANEPYTSTAKGTGSVAIGSSTQARGDYSHAEGGSARALGLYSHAEGSGTEASNDYEHAQGIYNHSSPNQIFSVGAGEMTPDYHVNYRNAISVLAVPNSDTQVVTASFFVQNVGGYDGTNPTPGTNDLATVLNNTETWTFTLDDGSTVTKTIRIV